MFKALWALLALALSVAFAAPAAAAPIKETLRYAPSAQCAAAAARANGPDWTWLEVSRPINPGLGSSWLLQVDQTRFKRIAVLVARPGAPSVLLSRSSDRLGDVQSLGNRLAFPMTIPAADVDRLCLGYQGLDDIALMRSVKALSPHAHAQQLQSWTGLTMAVCGVLLCALAYNLFLMTWLRSRFQRWYAVWLASGIAYALCWTGMVPQLLERWT